MTTTTGTTRRRKGPDIGRLLSDNGALGGLLLLVVTLSLLTPTFLTAQNLLNVGVQAAVVAVLAFGQTFVIVSAGVDLSVGSVAALSGIVAAYTAAETGLPGWLALIAGLGVGALAGLINGVLVSYGRLPAFIATLAMLSVARGLTLVVSQGAPKVTPDEVTFLGSTIGDFLPVPLLVMLGVLALTSFILNRTYPGRTMYAIGGNEEAAMLSGIDVRKNKLIIYALSGLFAGIAGILLAGRLGSAGPQAAVGYELDAIAAVVIGGASLSGGVGRASGAFVGALVLAVLRNGLNLVQVSPFWQQVVIGVVIAVAVLVDTLRRRSR